MNLTSMFDFYFPTILHYCDVTLLLPGDRAKYLYIDWRQSPKPVHV